MMLTQDASSRTTFYRSIGENLKREIETGRFADSRVLPGERELSASPGVSRATRGSRP
jgi:DNA-binding FadR family transcriptional regulator